MASIKELKFRAWDGVNKRFIYIDLSQNPIYWADKLHDDYILTEFIGIRDSDQTDIYHGDVLSVNTHNCGYFEVVWKNDGSATFGLMKRGDFYDDDRWEFFCNVNPKQITIVGNIFQNTDEFKNK